MKIHWNMKTHRGIELAFMGFFVKFDFGWEVMRFKGYERLSFVEGTNTTSFPVVSKAQKMIFHNSKS